MKRMHSFKKCLALTSRLSKRLYRFNRDQRLIPICRTCTTTSRNSDTGVLPPPAIDGTDKDYSPKIQKIVTDISHLTLLEVADLNELLKKTLKIQDAPIMAMGAAPVAAAAPKEEEEEEAVTEKRQKTSFSVMLKGFDPAKKVALIKELKNLVSGMNLVQAKKFVESAPQKVKEDIGKTEAEDLKKAIEAVGGQADIV